jgi:ParB-like chromosome segregation protein Spo0J
MMAISVATQESVRRTDILLVSPFDVVVREELRGRKFPPTEEDIVHMAMSIFDNGQRQPIECRRITLDGTKNRLQATAGFTRTNAIRLIREGFVGTDGVRRHDSEFKVKVTVVDCSDEDALVHNIVENAHRNQTSDIDDAYNQDLLRERYGYNDTEIARLYQYSNSVKVGRLRQLLQLNEEEQLLVHRGLLSTQAALDLLNLDQEERQKIIAELQNGDKQAKIKGSAVADQVREHILSDNGKTTNGFANSDTNGKFKQRSMANLRKYLLVRKEDENEEYGPATQRFASDMLKWLQGKTTDKAMDNALERLRAAA